MVEYPFYKRDIYASVKDMLVSVANKHGGNTAYRYLENGKIVTKTYDQFLADVYDFVAYIQEKELVGKHIAMLGKTSYRWLVCFFGAIISGSVAVPIDKELDKASILEQLRAADVTCLTYDPAFEYISQCFLAEDVYNRNVLCLSSDLKGSKNSSRQAEIYENNYDEHALALIIFTSGTTGRTKPVMLSQKNIIVDACSVAMVVDGDENICALSVLPPNHMFELVSSILCIMYFGGTLCINDSLRNLKKNLRLFKPSVLAVVPQFVDTFYKEIRGDAKKRNLLVPFEIKRWLCIILKQFHIDMTRSFFRTIHETFGGNLQLLICGGAMLEKNKVKFFNSIGIPIVEGYGITECSPVVACNTDRFMKLGSVGKVLPCSQVKTVDGEIAVKGDNVMLGYYKDSDETLDAIRDGWFYTGDLGYVDNDGYLFLTGRKKNLIILSNGENVSPEELEMKLKEIEDIREIMVYCENDHICVDVYYGVENLEIENKIKSEISYLTRKWPTYKQPNIVNFRYTEFKKTATGKIRRSEND